MTRVEKYSRYRKDIANMKVESFSSKKEATEMIENSTGNKVGYEEVIDIHNLYNSGELKVTKKHSINLRKDQIIYCVVAILCIAIILIGIIFVGIDLWGK